MKSLPISSIKMSTKNSFCLKSHIQSSRRFLKNYFLIVQPHCKGPINFWWPALFGKTSKKKDNLYLYPCLLYFFVDNISWSAAVVIDNNIIRVYSPGSGSVRILYRKSFRRYLHIYNDLSLYVNDLFIIIIITKT